MVALTIKTAVGVVVIKLKHASEDGGTNIKTAV